MWYRKFWNIFIFSISCIDSEIMVALKLNLVFSEVLLSFNSDMFWSFLDFVKFLGSGADPSCLPNHLLLVARNKSLLSQPCSTRNSRDESSCFILHQHWSLRISKRAVFLWNDQRMNNLLVTIFVLISFSVSDGSFTFINFSTSTCLGHLLFPISWAWLPNRVLSKWMLVFRLVLTQIVSACSREGQWFADGFIWKIGVIFYLFLHCERSFQNPGSFVGRNFIIFIPSITVIILSEPVGVCWRRLLSLLEQSALVRFSPPSGDFHTRRPSLKTKRSPKIFHMHQRLC